MLEVLVVCNAVWLWLHYSMYEYGIMWTGLFLTSLSMWHGLMLMIACVKLELLRLQKQI